MKIKTRFLLFLAICIATMCVRCVHTAAAQDLSEVAKGKLCNSGASTSIACAREAFEAKHYKQAIDYAKRVISASAIIDDRIEAYKILLTSVRCSQGYNAAIARAEKVYAFVVKTRLSHSRETKCVRAILSDLKQRRRSYEKTIIEQRNIIEASPQSDNAAQAALKIAICKQNLGSPKDALNAYEEVIRHYPLTRPGWKALEEATILRQDKTDSELVNHAKSASTNCTAIEDLRMYVREGQYSKAEQIARNLVTSNSQNVRSETSELLVQAITASVGTKEAIKQVWQLACGSPNYTPRYSDVLRFEAYAYDLSEKLAKEDIKIAKQSSNANNPSMTSSAQSISDAKALNDGLDHQELTGYSYNSQAAMPSLRSERTRVGSGMWSGMSTRVKSLSHQPQATNLSQSHVDVIRPTSVDKKQTDLPNSSRDRLKPLSPDLPVEITDPEYFDQWTCAKEYEKAGDDLDKIRNLVQEHIEKAQELLKNKETRLERRGLGVVLGCAICAFDKLEDQDWALNICRDHVLPHISSANPENYDYLAKPLVLGRVIRMWVAAGQYNPAIDMLATMLGDELNARQADALKVRLGQVYELDGQYEMALKCLLAIDDKSDLAGAKQYIPELEQKIEEKDDE